MLSGPILTLCILANASSLADELSRDRGWAAGTIAEQLNVDVTLIPFGKGAIFVPAMTDPLDEPPVSVLQDGKRVAEGTTGKRIPVFPGTYQVRMGSGSVEQRFIVHTTVRELNTSVVPVSWAGLAVHVVDETMNSLRGSYELIRVEEREYIGIGFGADEQAGEPVSTWILKPGLYKIVRVGETYRARRDFATVRLMSGRLTHFQLVLDANTNEFRGGGEIPEEELFAFGRGALWTTLIFGGDLSMVSRRNRIGSTDGESYEIRVFLDTKLSLEILHSPLILRLQIEEGWNKSPEFPWQTSQDRADLDGLYVYRIRPWIGPYLRFSAETNLLQGWAFFNEPTDIVVLRPDSTIRREKQDAERLLLSSPLGLTQVKEGVGLNVRLFKSVIGETSLRTGVGARHRITGGLLRLTSDEDADPLLFERVGDNNQIGIEATVLAVLRFTRWVVANFEVDTLIPFSNLDQIILDMEASLAVKLTRFISINYVLRFQRDTELSPEQPNQLEHDIRLRFSFEFF
jgi:hypothetical protein